MAQIQRSPKQGNLQALPHPACITPFMEHGRRGAACLHAYLSSSPGLSVAFSAAPVDAPDHHPQNGHVNHLGYNGCPVPVSSFVAQRQQLKAPHYVGQDVKAKQA